VTVRGWWDPGWYNPDQSLKVGQPVSDRGVEVDARPFGQYTFTFGDGRWVTIEAEEDPGHVNDASRGFPVGDCDPAWAGRADWALTVVFSDVVRAPDPH
jgi:hypothetical protein